MKITWRQTVESSTIKVGKVINVGQGLPLSGLRWRLRLGEDLDLDLGMRLRLGEDVRPADHTGGGGRRPTGLAQYAARVHPGLQCGA